MAYTSDLSAYAKVAYINSISEGVGTEADADHRPVILKGTTGHSSIPVTLSSWEDGIYKWPARTYVDDGYMHIWRQLDSLKSETTKELLEVARTLSESTELSPKTYNALGTLAADTVLTMNAGRHTVPEYQGEFSFGDTVYAVTFPEEVIWNVTPAYLPNKRYQFSILNGLGVMCEFPLSNETSE